jgi:trimethylamine-N-oxide reductase (cytochrome c)
LDFIKVGEIDRGGCINTITPEKLSSKNCVGMATSGFLVQVERLNPGEYDIWREEHPDAFERDYAPGSGTRVSAWIDSGIE